MGGTLILGEMVAKIDVFCQKTSFLGAPAAQNRLSPPHMEGDFSDFSAKIRQIFVPPHMGGSTKNIPPHMEGEHPPPYGGGSFCHPPLWGGTFRRKWGGIFSNGWFSPMGKIGGGGDFFCSPIGPNSGGELLKNGPPHMGGG